VQIESATVVIKEYAGMGSMTLTQLRSSQLAPPKTLHLRLGGVARRQIWPNRISWQTYL